MAISVAVTDVSYFSLNPLRHWAPICNGHYHLVTKSTFYLPHVAAFSFRLFTKMPTIPLLSACSAGNIVPFADNVRKYVNRVSGIFLGSSARPPLSRDGK